MPQRDDQPNEYLLRRKQENRISPLNSSSDDAAAVDLIRQKISTLYEEEPAATAERKLADTSPEKERSKHQQFMHELSISGKSLAEIQTAWHQYYQNLPEHEKHEVWQEFYQQHGREHTRQSRRHRQPQVEKHETHSNQLQSASSVEGVYAANQPTDTPQEEPDDIRQRILQKVAGSNKKKQANVKSVVFGLGMGFAVLLIGAFGFFNERVIAPFITPSTVMSSTPLILDESAPVGDEAKIIIPKINVEIPVVYGEESIAEDDVQNALEEGVLHYPITPEPGEVGNSVFFGHSSNNLLNSGNYKFAFVLLNRLEEGDTFMLEKDGTRYVYRVFDKEVVPPTDFSVLDSHPEKDSIATLITCDPPGTSINRLAVYGEQISPDPAENTESSVQEDRETPQELPSDAPTLWQRWFGS